MGKLDSYTDKVMDLVGHVGGSLRDTIPGTAGKWLQTGAAIGAAKAGSKAVGGFVRRNPAVAIAAAVGAGVLYYAVRRHQKKKQANGGVIEGTSQRIEAKRAAPRKRKTPAVAKDAAE